MTKKILLIVGILLLAIAAFVWFNSAANTRKMTEPIQKQLSNRSGVTFQLASPQFTTQ